MKLSILFLAVMLCGCSSTNRTADKKGHYNWRIQGNYQHLAIHDHGPRGFDLDATGVDHSTPTLAGGTAFKMGADSIGTTVVSGLLTGGLPWQSGVAAASSVIPQIVRPAVPAVLQAKH